MMVQKVGKKGISKYTFNEISLVEKANLKISKSDYVKS